MSTMDETRCTRVYACALYINVYVYAFAFMCVYELDIATVDNFAAAAAASYILYLSIDSLIIAHTAYTASYT